MERFPSFVVLMTLLLLMDGGGGGVRGGGLFFVAKKRLIIAALKDFDIGRMNYLQIQRNEREVEQACHHPNCHRKVFKRPDSGNFEYQTPSSHRGTLSTAIHDNLDAGVGSAALRLRRHAVAKRVYSDIADVCIAFHCRGKVPGSYGYLKCASDNRCLG